LMRYIYGSKSTKHETKTSLKTQLYN